MNIKDVIITELKIIKDNRGKVMHMMRNDSNVFKSFGEIYFSTIFKDAVKAWHLHKEATLNYACVKGKEEFQHRIEHEKERQANAKDEK